jgi:excisionase family DNA binding protein
MPTKLEASKDSLLTAEQAAERLAIRESTVRAWVHRRQIGYVKIGRSLRIRASEVDDLIENGFVPKRGS